MKGIIMSNLKCEDGSPMNDGFNNNTYNLLFGIMIIFQKKSKVVMKKLLHMLQLIVLQNY